MSSDKVVIKNIKDIDCLAVNFEFENSKLIVMTGKNGVGKTSLAKAFKLIDDPLIFNKSAGLNAIRNDSEITFNLDGHDEFSFRYNSKIGALDTKDKLPSSGKILSELPVPYGERFNHFSLISRYDSEIRSNIAASRYRDATKLKEFLNKIYSTNKFDRLKETEIGKRVFYFTIQEGDYYIREDHLSSGEFFLIQLYRIITSGAELIFVDELDVALDAAAQVKLFGAISPLLDAYGSRLIVISHSLAFMSTVANESLYYLERNSGNISIEPRSFAYIKSDLYGFVGFDRYILTEDEVLEGFINYIISSFSIVPYYRHSIIGVAGINQLQMLVEKNDVLTIFSESKNVRCIMDGDAHPDFAQKYCGPTQVICSPFEDIEKYIFLNRDTLLPHIERPSFQESKKVKTASKTYWKWLTIDKKIHSNQLYALVVDSNPEQAESFANNLREFLVY